MEFIGKCSIANAAMLRDVDIDESLVLWDLPLVQQNSDDYADDENDSQDRPHDPN